MINEDFFNLILTIIKNYESFLIFKLFNCIFALKYKFKTNEFYRKYSKHSNSMNLSFLREKSKKY